MNLFNSFNTDPQNPPPAPKQPSRLLVAIFIVFLIILAGIISYAYTKSQKNEGITENKEPIITSITQPAPNVILEKTVQSPKKILGIAKDPIGLTLFSDGLTWQTGRILAYVDIPTPKVTALEWANPNANVTSTEVKQVRGTYYYAIVKHKTPVPAPDLVNKQKNIEKYFADELQKLEFVRRGPFETLTTLDDDYIGEKDGQARAVSLHISADYNTNCPEHEKTIVGEICAPISVINEIYSIFISDSFTPSWKY